MRYTIYNTQYTTVTKKNVLLICDLKVNKLLTSFHSFKNEINVPKSSDLAASVFTEKTAISISHV